MPDLCPWFHFSDICTAILFKLPLLCSLHFFSPSPLLNLIEMTRLTFLIPSLCTIFFSAVESKARSTCVFTLAWSLFPTVVLMWHYGTGTGGRERLKRWVFRVLKRGEAPQECGLSPSELFFSLIPNRSRLDKSKKRLRLLGVLDLAVNSIPTGHSQSWVL